jgi:hypothetical protein
MGRLSQLSALSLGWSVIAPFHVEWDTPLRRAARFRGGIGGGGQCEGIGGGWQESVTQVQPSVRPEPYLSADLEDTLAAEIIPALEVE